MTTEAANAIEVNGSENPETPQNEPDDSPAEKIEVSDNPGSTNPGEAEQVDVPKSPSSPTSPGQKSPSKQKKEAHESKGISRFLPPWLKKQKSISQTEPKEENKDHIDGSPEEEPEKEAEVNNKEETSEEAQPVVAEGAPSPEKKAESTTADIQVSIPFLGLHKVYHHSNSNTVCGLVCHGCSPWQFVFNVKFYPPDPAQLTEDITRYYLCLQLRQDIATGRLPCSFVTHALLGSLMLQAEVGDYDEDELSADYISDFQFAPNQTKELEDKVVELHKTHRGLTPAQADITFLENAKKLSMYGVDLHHAKDSEAVDIMLGVCANGLLIYKDRLRINRFAWPKILKISYKRSNFFIKVRPGELEQFESTIGFKLPNHRAAKRLWKVCVEHHTFYRLSSPEQPPKARFLTLGSKFRYSGRTQSQTREASTRIDRPAPYFERTSSKRVSRSLDGAPLGGITDQSLLKDIHVPGGGSAVDGVVPGSEAATQEAHDHVSTPSTPSVFPNDTKSKSLRVHGENIYVRHSNLMLEDLDKSQDEILRHQASISELKRTFMESTPEPRPNEWEKRCITPLPLQTHGNSDETQNIVEEKKQADSDITHTTVKEDLKAEINGDIEHYNDVSDQNAEVKDLDKNDTQSLSSYDSSSESENEEVEYKAESRASDHVIPEEPEESVEDVKEVEPVKESQISEDHAVTLTVTEIQEKTEVISQEITVSTFESEEKVEEVHEVHLEEQNKINGDVSHIDVDSSSQIICCSEPPVVKTEMVTLSDATQRTEISTKEVPIVQTETKTITFESAQLDGAGDSEPGILLSAQTITSDSVLTTTTTHITKTGKGGVSETRIEKRIVISGDADIDHDEALAQAIKEAKEQHPDMSITRVVVHKETEVTEEGEEE
ncbi:hypothetical protein GDO81_008165 [Engystomops pustulosus]|uniref:FERM domain-containing protein n=1 Tax=Engystomops pustulosus TaxID=76066 RepID=A0AAV7CDF1_ENGPU|nr:hypothetical protein GDO81_008165 [Engystomops pustulosus]